MQKSRKWSKKPVNLQTTWSKKTEIYTENGPSVVNCSRNTRGMIEEFFKNFKILDHRHK